MSLKCSIFGHSFGDPVVDREREETGSEVVITIRETQTCSRCGQERVVSENKEVTTLETPDDAEPSPDSPATPSASSGDTREETTTATDESGGTSTAGGSDEGTAEPAIAETDPEMDDATIIEDSPEESIVEEAEPAESPSVSEIAGTTATESDSEDDDAVILEDEPAEDDQDSGRGPGEWPEEPDDDEPEWEPPTDVSTAAQPDPADEQASEVEPTGEAVTVPDGTFHCPECGFSTPVESSSLRAGDFCPDCHTGTLEHEPDRS